jgi:hypothetical protein
MDIISYIPKLIFSFFALSIIVTFFIQPENFQKTRVYVFVSMMASIAVVVLGLNVIVNTSTLEFQKSVSQVDFTTKATNKNWVYPNKVISEKKNLRPEFVASLYLNNKNLQKLVKNLKTKQTIESENEEQFVCILLLQCFEDYLTIRHFDTTGDVVWVVNYLQWAQSIYLKNSFKTLKYNYAKSTIKFAELLFEYAKTLIDTSQSANDYQLVALKFLKDQRVVDLYQKKNY